MKLKIEQCFIFHDGILATTGNRKGNNSTKSGKMGQIDRNRWKTNLSNIRVSIQGQYNYLQLELQWRQAPPCSSWDTGRKAPFIFSPGVKSLNQNFGNHDKKVAVELVVVFPWWLKFELRLG